MELMERRRILLDTPHISLQDGMQFNTDMVAPIESLVMNFSPIQDLHGYDSPWPAGGGKNLLDTNVNAGTPNNVTYTNNGDGTYTVNGTASGTSTFVVGSVELTANTQYIVSGCPSGGSGSSYNVRIRDANYTALGFDVGGGVTITPTETKTYYYQITVVSGYSVSNLVFKPMICLSTAPNPDYAHFAPYSNICPITGWTGLDVTRTGKNLYDCAEFSSYKRADGTYRLTGADATATKVYFPEELVGKEIVASVYLDLTKETGPSYIRLRAVIDGVSKNGGAVNNNNAGYSTVTVTPTSTSDYLYMTYGSNGSNYYTFSQFQVEFRTGSGRTSYEPYTSSRYSINWGENLIGGLAFAEQVKKVMPAATLDTTAQTISFSGTTTSLQPIEIVTGIFKPNTQYTFIHTGTTGNTKNIRWIYDDDSVDTANRPANSAYVSTAGKTVKALEKINNNGASVTFQYMNCGVFEGVLEVDDFEPYVGEVYGGTVDFTTGVLTVNKKTVSVNAIDYVLANYIKSDAVDGYVNVNEIYPVKGSTGYGADELAADRLNFQNKSIWATVGSPNCWTVNGLQVHINVANGLLGITDYTQETTTTAKTKLNAWLANNPVTITIPIRPVTYQLTPQQIFALKGINNLSMSGRVKFWTHRDIQ